MVFYGSDVSIGLVLVSLPAILSVYFFFFLGKEKVAIALLLTSALLLRILMISLDPYVHEWDERYHALVAKHMISQPFKPMLFTKQIMTFNPLDWGSFHIWVHKQPLFLWQMAASMKLFGANTFALRLPSALAGTILIWLTYDIARKWTLNNTVAYISAFIATFSFTTLELISGRLSLDHNDLIFIFYMTCCFWAFTKYTDTEKKIKWAILIGVFAGLAILNKWLVGLLIFGGWGLYILLSEHKYNVKYYLHLLISVLTTCIVFVPWQIYILHAFPVESSISFAYNKLHISDNLGHPGSMLYHIQNLLITYNTILIVFLIVGSIGIFLSKHIDNKISIAFIGMMIVIYSFFSIFVATKMPAFVYPVSSLLIILMAYGIYITGGYIFTYLRLIPQHRNQLFCLATILVGFYSLKPNLIIDERSSSNVVRNNKINNSSIFKNMDGEIANKYVILNCRPYENIELMFYKDILAYHWYPSEHVLDSLQHIGYTFAAFDYKNDQQQLPSYITTDSTILILKEQLK